MLKFYHKKEISLEKTPILLRLERRHTLMEGSQESSKERRASRANSVGSTGGTASNVSTPVEKTTTPSTVVSDDKQSIFSRASTVVITESELSSSWLYNSKKAQIDSTNETILDSKSGMASNNANNLESETRQDSRPKPPAPTRRQTSCCCYLTIASFICIASLGILAAIGGIIYMELFSSYVEKISHSTVELGHSREIPWNMVNSSAGETPNEVESFLDETLQKGTTVSIGESVEGIGLPGKIESSKTLTPKTEQFSDNEFNSSVTVQNESDLLQDPTENDSISINIGKDSMKADDKGNGSLEGFNESLENGESSKEVTRVLSDQDKLDLFMKFNEAVNKHFFINESQLLRKLPSESNSTSETEFEQDNDFGKHELDNNLENSSYSGIDHLINEELVPKTNDSLDLNSDRSINAIQGQLAYLPLDEIMDTSTNKNIPEAEFDHPNENFHHSIDPKTDSFPPSNNPNDGKETSDEPVEKDLNTLLPNRINSPFNDSVSEQVTENFSNEQKSLPFEFFRRLGFNEASLIAHPALTVEDMNVKFSLAEALKYLRSLDTSNKLPTSRQKPDIPQNNRSPQKMADAGKEREEYLAKLRENLYN